MHCRRDHSSTGATLAVPFTPATGATPSQIRSEISRSALRTMSALSPKADIGTQSWNVRVAPKADICGSIFCPLFLGRRFGFQGLKPVCIQHSPRHFLIDIRANLFMKSTEQRLVLIRTL